MFRKKLIFIDVEEIRTPKDGFIVLLDRWWALKEGKVILFDNMPQCNKDKEIAEMVSKKLYSGTVIFISIAYIPCT